jgi:hypothetical protein
VVGLYFLVMATRTSQVVAAFFLALPLAHAGSPKTCSNPQLSCQNTTAISDTCCFNAPGGQLLQTQFWDTSPSTGPSNSWTIHGLWPDHCDGTYDSNCDPSRAYTNITAILQSYGKTDLLAYMVSLNFSEVSFLLCVCSQGWSNIQQLVGYSTFSCSTTPGTIYFRTIRDKYADSIFMR